jgi:hypothetical protein
MKSILTVLAAGAFVLAPLMAVAAPAVGQSPIGRLAGPVTSDAPRHVGPGTWEQGFHFAPAAEVAAALQVELDWVGDGPVDARFTSGAAAAEGAKGVDGERIGDRRFRVVIAGVNRTILPSGEIFRITFYAPEFDGRGAFRVADTLAVDPDGAVVLGSADVTAPPQGRGAKETMALDPHVDLIFNAVTIIPGQTQKQTVTIHAVDGADPAAVQLDVRFDPSALSFKSVDIGSAGSVANKTAKASLIASNLLRVIVHGNNTTAIPDGDLVKIGWQASNAVPRGTVTNLDCGGSIVADGLGFTVPTTCWGGGVVYIGNMRCDVNLDGRVDVIDIQAAINKVTKLSGPLVDVNCNGREDVQDIQQITDGALGLNCPTPGANSCP